MDRIIKPMEPVAHGEIFDSKDYLYQVKWDGVRMLAYIDGDSVRLVNKRLNPRTLQYPELQKLSDLLNAHKAVLDGEIIVLKNSNPSFPSILRRDRCSASRTIAYLSKHLPIDYMLFDILLLNDRNLIPLPLEERAAVLAETVNFAHPHVHLIENFVEGSSLFTAVKAREMEGIVAKKKDSPYIEGKKHRDWLKIKYRRSLHSVIVGYTLRNNEVNSLLLGLYSDELLLYIGRAGSGLSEDDRKTLSSALPDIALSAPPFAEHPSAKMDNCYFTRPLLTVRVEFAEWSENMILRSPVIKEFTSINPQECTL